MSYKLHQNSPNRRISPRISQCRGVKILNISANRYVPAETVDLSPNGFQLRLPASAALVAGAMVEVHVAPMAGGSQLASRRSMSRARVVWVDRSEAGVRVGLEYVVAMAGAAVSAA